ncbi:hypothetical protein PSH03_005741 [Micromonospora sp. PSH03]|nr:hypothetical protein [Micromonospora salmantinae]MCG5459943.1 hypothetical protein [Micromonospora salmantinae]
MGTTSRPTANPTKSADRGIDEARNGQVTHWRFQGGDEHRCATGLGEQGATALEQDGDDDRQYDDQAGLPGPDAEQWHERVTDGEPENDPDQQLDGAPQACAHRGGHDADSCGGREDRGGIVQDLGSHEPGDRRRDAGLHGEQPEEAEPPGAGAQPVPHPLGQAGPGSVGP